MTGDDRVFDSETRIQERAYALAVHPVSRWSPHRLIVCTSFLELAAADLDDGRVVGAHRALTMRVDDAFKPGNGRDGYHEMLRIAVWSCNCDYDWDPKPGEKPPSLPAWMNDEAKRGSAAALLRRTAADLKTILEGGTTR